MQQQLIALVDCNNFYVSCERVFKPSLRKKAVVVLSNNDGCIISRSDEAKALGIEMGDPCFLHKDKIRRGELTVFSSNYTLYADMSQRVMTLLCDFECDVEVYSIDEAFLCFYGKSVKETMALAFEMRQKILQCTGLPISVGLSYTKTLAKLANRYAKKGFGVFDLLEDQKIEAVLRASPVDDLWGVGRRTAEKLRFQGLRTAYDLSRADPEFIRKRLTIVGLRTQQELKKISSITFETEALEKKNISSAKSFGSLTDCFVSIEEALSNYVVTCSEKMRKQKLCAEALYVFLEYKRPHEVSRRSGSVSQKHKLEFPSDDTFLLLRESKKLLRQIYCPGVLYKKVGVMLLGLEKKSHQVNSLLFSDSKQEAKREKLLKLLDRVNQVPGSRLLTFASQGIEKSWQPKSAFRSQNFTTQWREIPRVQ